MATKAEWKRDDECPSCERCHKPFTVFRRRHHCRHCGYVFCNNCSLDKTVVEGYDRPQRVCVTCTNTMKNVLEVGKKRPRERKVCIVGGQESGRSTLYKRALGIAIPKQSSGRGTSGTTTSTTAARTQSGNTLHTNHSIATVDGSTSTPNYLQSSKTLAREYRGSSYVLTFINTALEQDGLLQPHFTIGTDVFLILYSVADRSTFEVIENARERIADCGAALRTILLIANKVDVDSASRVVSREEGEAVAREWGVRYWEMSALNTHDVDSLLHEIVRVVGDIDIA